MQKTFAVIVIIALLFAFSGCGNDTKQSQGYSFTDDLGRKITISDSKKTAALLGSFADMWMLTGGEICAAADDAWEDFNLPLGDNAVNLGATQRPDKERLLASAPDFVLASSLLSAHLDLRETLEGAGIAVAYFDVGDFASFLRVLRIFADINGNEESYELYGEAQKEKIDSILSRNKDKDPCKVLVMRASATSIRVKNSDGTMLGGMLRDFGCVNIADSDSMLLENLSVESIVKHNPDKIFFVETGDDLPGIRKAVEDMFEQNPLWRQLTAVREGRVYYMDKHLYNLKPNANFAKAYENLEKILYEE